MGEEDVKKRGRIEKKTELEKRKERNRTEKERKQKEEKKKKRVDFESFTEKCKEGEKRIRIEIRVRNKG